MKRTFVGIPIQFENEALVQRLWRLRQNLANETISWVDPVKQHLTIFFLGNTQDELVPGIIQGLTNAIQGITKITITMRNIGFFGPAQLPRVLWLGIDPQAQLHELYVRVCTCLDLFGFQPDRKTFHPHLTLGRIRHLRSLSTLEKSLARFGQEELQTSVLQEVVWYESSSTDRGSVYIPLARFPLI